MPKWNSERYLSAAIESILGQISDDFEFLICDDGSTDASDPFPVRDGHQQADLGRALRGRHFSGAEPR
jgi:hypothetical protein